MIRISLSPVSLTNGRYPIEGYLPVQAPCSVDVARAELLFTQLHKLLPRMLEDDQVSAVMIVFTLYLLRILVCLLLFAQILIFHFLMRISYFCYFF